MSVRVACLQMNSGAQVQENLAFIAQQTELAAEEGVNVLQLPENFAQMPARASDQVVEVEGDGEIQNFLCNLASSTEVALLAGALPIRDRQQQHQNPYARCLAIDETGEVRARYDKIHLFNVALPGGEEYRESDRFSPAAQPDKALTTVELGGVRIGLSICYDLRFPEQYRALTENGAQLLSVPSAFTFDTGRVHWQTLLQARAIENLCYVFAAAQTGQHASGRSTWGHSMIIDPWGKVVADAGTEPGLIIADIDLTFQRDLRQRFPALQHTRLD